MLKDCAGSHIGGRDMSTCLFHGPSLLASLVTGSTQCHIHVLLTREMYINLGALTSRLEVRLAVWAGRHDQGLLQYPQGENKTWDLVLKGEFAQAVSHTTRVVIATW